MAEGPASGNPAPRRVAVGCAMDIAFMLLRWANVHGDAPWFVVEAVQSAPR